MIKKYCLKSLEHKLNEQKESPAKDETPKGIMDFQLRNKSLLDKIKKEAPIVSKLIKEFDLEAIICSPF